MKSLCERQSKSFFCKFYQALFPEPLKVLELQKLPWKSASRWALDTHLHTPAHSPWSESPPKQRKGMGFLMRDSCVPEGTFSFLLLQSNKETVDLVPAFGGKAWQSSRWQEQLEWTHGT